MDTTKFPVIASGGISSILHLKILKKLGAEGAIIGRALYTGAINLSQALAAVES
jgi:phosphoribosylformimino-5-aminoimidazole carboxamide ribotide isomerase